jgi:hypothetical protein
VSLADDVASVGRGFAVGGAVVLAVASIVILPDKLQHDPAPVPPAVAPAQVGTAPGSSVAEPFPGWNPAIEAWSAEYGWGPVDDLVARWSNPAPTTVTQITP